MVAQPNAGSGRGASGARQRSTYVRKHCLRERAGPGRRGGRDRVQLPWRAREQDDGKGNLRSDRAVSAQHRGQRHAFP